MLKLLRNFALAGLLLAGAVKLLAWWAVGRDAQRVVAALAPIATIKYEGISAGLDGSVSLDKVTLDAGHRVYRADSVVFESPSVFWLLAHAVLGSNSLPAQFAVSAEGLRLPPLPWLDPQWIDPATFVVFPSAGCGSGFSDADYQRMGVKNNGTQERLDYHYDADQHTLNLALELKAPGYAHVQIEADLKQFNPDSIASPAMWNKVHVEQASADYTDLDFLAKRNQFCAQRVGSPNPAQFIERHINAVQDLAKQKRVEPSSEVVQLYRTLLDQGGKAGVLSLPSSGFVIGAVHSGPDDLLHQLNVTARYKDKPPIMFRLAFAPAPPEEAQPTPPVPEVPATTAAVPAHPATPSTAPAPTPPANLTPATPALATTPAPSPLKPTATTPAPAPPKATPEPPKAVVAATPAPAPPVAPAKAPEATPAKPPAHDDLGLHNLDREEAKLAALPGPLSAPKREVNSALVPTPPLIASAERPAAGSVQALVWKPSVFETLPEAEPEEHNYEVIEYARLESMVGRYVQVVTEGGRKIGGYVVGVDDVGVKLRVDRPGGNVTFVVTKARVHQVRLPRY
jgi:hypothetical protein